MLLQQTTFENIVTKGEIFHTKQLLHLTQCFQLYLIIELSFMENFQIFARILSKSSAADFLYGGKGLRVDPVKISYVMIDSCNSQFYFSFAGVIYYTCNVIN